MSDFRAAIHAGLQAVAEAPSDGEAERLLSALAAPGAVWHVAWPIEDLAGPEAIAAGWLRPLRQALPRYLRRPEIVVGGRSRTGSGQWLACLGHHVGNFEAPLFGIPPHGKLVFLRSGEFYRLDAAGLIAEAYILPDLLDLARQTGRMPFAFSLGAETLFPAPATHDGVLPPPDADRALASAALVEAMLTDLRAYDPASFASAGQTGRGGYWDERMLWYGPAGIGANFTYPGFQRDHRVPFLTAFPDRVGGNHFARLGDGDYVCSGGWPSMTMTHAGPYLGVPATGRRLSLRVMDFWRVAASAESRKIAENWVLLDLPDLFRQMGVDLLARLAGDS